MASESGEGLSPPEISEDLLYPRNKDHNPEVTIGRLQQEENYLLQGGDIDPNNPPEPREYLRQIDQDAIELARIRSLKKELGLSPDRSLLGHATPEPSFFANPMVRKVLGLDIPFKYRLASYIPLSVSGIATTTAVLTVLSGQYSTTIESGVIGLAAFIIGQAILVMGYNKKSQDSGPDLKTSVPSF